MFGVRSINETNNIIGIPPQARVSVLVVNAVIIVLGIFGNSLVLYSSLWRNAIRMDRTSLMLLQSIAVSDIFITIQCFVPMFVSLYSDGWVLGEEVCFLLGAFYTVPFHNEILIIVLISLEFGSYRNLEKHVQKSNDIM